MTTRKFHKTTIMVVVLSEYPLPEMDLEGIHYAITSGDCSGHVSRISEEEMDGKQAADALAQQASDAFFFNLTNEGEDA